MKSTGFLFLLMGMFALVTVIESKLLEVGSYRLINDMPSQNLKIHNDTIYVGVRNKIISLNKNLELVKFYNTCKSGNQEDSCNNKNKVMILNKKADQLIVCGTGLDGVCELLGLPDFNRTNGANERFLSISVDINSPAIGVITRKGNLTIAVTNGPRASGPYIYKDYEGRKEYAISKRRLHTLGLWNDIYIKMEDKAIEADFVVKYKDGFQHKNYIYFVTNQYNYVTGVKKISKLVRLCEDDEHFFQGYVDIEIGCMDNDGSEYNLIQHIMKAETASGDVWFVGIFSRSDNSDGSPGDSVMCVTKLTDVDKVINSTWTNFLQCKQETLINNLNNLDPSRAYFEDKRNKEACNSPEPVEESWYSCENKLGGTFSYNIGVQKLNMTLKDTLESIDVTTAVLTGILDGRDNRLKGNNPVMILGTSIGNLHFYNLKINKEEFTVSRYLNYYLGRDVPITGIIQEDEDFLYVLSETMLYKLTSTNCSEFGSCQNTTKESNPLCGWCVLQNKATRRGQCTSGVNHWLSALDGKCPSFTYGPKGVKFGTTVLITLNLENIPHKQDGDIYKCIFRNNSSVLGTVDATLDGDNIKCRSPNVNVRVNSITSLELSLSGNIIASQPFIFYECQQFTKCGDCVSTDGVDCKWNRTTLECGTTGVNNKNSCPALSSNIKYIASDVKENVILTGSNLNTAGYTFKCQIDGQCFNAVLNGSLTCQDVKISTNTSKSEKPIKVKYGLGDSQDCSAMKDIDDEHSNKVIVYDCGKLVNQDCSKCCALNKERYKCNWNNDGCQYSTSTQCNVNRGCPKPIIDQLKPSDGPYNGGTVITLTGKHFGHWSDGTIDFYKTILPVRVDNRTCKVSVNKDDYNVHPGGSNTDYLLPFPTRIVCTVPQIDGGLPNNTNMLEVNVTLKVELSGPTSDPKQFTYKKPTFANIKPVKGIVAGKTRIFITGKNLRIGNKKITVYLKQGGDTECTDVGTTLDEEKSMAITCLTGSVEDAGSYEVKVVMDGNTYSNNLSFTYTANATIGNISPTKGFASGGTRITVTGERFENVQKKCIVLKFFSYIKETCCTDRKPGELICTVPALSDEQRNEIMKLSNKTRKKRSIDDGCISVGVVLQLDGLKHDFNIKYCRDPELEEFNDGVLLYGSDDKEIKIKGDYLTLVAEKDDFNVTVGVADCPVILLEKDEITCSHSHKSEDTHPDVNVTVGNIRKRVGHIQYQIDVNNTLVIAGAAAAGVAFLLVLLVVIGCCCYRKLIKKKEMKFNDEIKALEMKIIDVAKQEFLEMHTTMSSVKQNLVEQGFPYHTYQQYACNVMFAIDYLLTEPVVSNGKMTDDERFRAKKGLDSLEALISNKFFLISVIGTMEKQKKFFIREKSNLAGNLCAILMGRMDYVLEVLRVLLPNLVKESSGKKGQQKALFRRCESITEKLLSNWLSLCLYPHFKNYSGSPLYYMYLVLQKTIEAGPIDAITGDTKYTLSEEKLLKKSSCPTAEENLRFESNTLTLNVVVNDGTEVHKCKVLDCDTITQVKCKCLSQIYVHYPASQLNVDPDEIILEWHEGFGGKLKLQDHDSISVQEGKWVRLNTLAHYNVKDDSNVALVDPHALESMQLEDYVNLTSITMDVGGCNGSMDSTDPLTSPKTCDEELEYWHLVKKEEENTKQEKSAIDILYLNKLFTTKLAIKDHMTSLFEIILDHDKCPPPTKFLLHFMDELGEQSKVDNDTIHAWKSHSYAIRVWAALIKLPSILFDVEIPSYMNDNLDVISQVFIESFSLSSQKFTKDSPSQKTVFNHEMNECRERALEFYKNVKVDQQNQEEFRQYLVDVNKLQQTTSFNKVSALHRFYKQLEPYLGDIVEDLATCKETKDLQLDRKLENVMTIMNEENDD